ncbi:MAG TPA: DMT family transporter [Steroidobacteraceae bacterium]|nr:DMT family transporter [Steroidobacteraceae bacterium]
MRSRAWLAYAMVTTVFWGVWGAFTGLPANHGFPETLIYVVWAITMFPPALYALRRVGWRVQRDPKSIVLGALIGFLGAGGQMLLFHAVRIGPAYLIFPVISLSPLVTVVMSLALLHERTGKLGALGIVLALCSLPLFDYTGSTSAGGYGQLWFLLALGVLAAWGVQAFFMKLANATMDAESIFFYMTITGLLLVPVAIAMTDFSVPINWGADGPYLAGAIQILNAVGALTLVYAFRYGKAIVVSPLTNAGAPLITAMLSIMLLGTAPTATKIAGIALALCAAVLLAIEPEAIAADTAVADAAALRQEPDRS